MTDSSTTPKYCSMPVFYVYKQHKILPTVASSGALPIGRTTQASTSIIRDMHQEIAVSGYQVLKVESGDTIRV